MSSFSEYIEKKRCIGTTYICHTETAEMLFYLENLFISCIGICSCKEANVCRSLTGAAGGGGVGGWVAFNMQSISKSTVLCYFLSGRLK